MTKKLFIGSLDFTTTEAQLTEHFATVGKVVSAKIIIDRYTGQGKGFGFVEMESQEAAKEAIARLNGTQLTGRSIAVKEALPPKTY